MISCGETRLQTLLNQVLTGGRDTYCGASFGLDNDATCVQNYEAMVNEGLEAVTEDFQDEYLNYVLMGNPWAYDACVVEHHPVAGRGIAASRARSATAACTIAAVAPATASQHRDVMVLGDAAPRYLTLNEYITEWAVGRANAGHAPAGDLEDGVILDPAVAAAIQSIAGDDLFISDQVIRIYREALQYVPAADRRDSGVREEIITSISGIVTEVRGEENDDDRMSDDVFLRYLTGAYADGVFGEDNLVDIARVDESGEDHPSLLARFAEHAGVEETDVTLETIAELRRLRVQVEDDLRGVTEFDNALNQLMIDSRTPAAPDMVFTLPEMTRYREALDLLRTGSWSPALAATDEEEEETPVTNPNPGIDEALVSIMTRDVLGSDVEHFGDQLRSRNARVTACTMDVDDDNLPTRINGLRLSFGQARVDEIPDELRVFSNDQARQATAVRLWNEVLAEVGGAGGVERGRSELNGTPDETALATNLARQIRTLSNAQLPLTYVNGVTRNGANSTVELRQGSAERFANGLLGRMAQAGFHGGAAHVNRLVREAADENEGEESGAAMQSIERNVNRYVTGLLNNSHATGRRHDRGGIFSLPDVIVRSAAPCDSGRPNGPFNIEYGFEEANQGGWMGYGTNWEFPNSSLRMNAQIDAVGLNSDAGVMLHLDAAWAGHRGTFLYGIGLEGDVIHSPGAINPSPEDALIEDIDGHTDFSSIRKAYARIGFQWADGDQSLTLSGPLIGARPGLAVTDDVLGSSPTPWGTFPYETSSRTAGFVGQYTLRHTPVALDIRVVAGSGGTSLNFEHPDTMTFWDGWNLSGDANLSVTVGDFVLGAMVSFGRVLSGSNEGSAAYGVAGGIHWGIRRWLNLDAAYRYVRNVDNTGVKRDDHTVAAQASGVLYRSSGNFEARYGVRGSYHSASGEDEVCPNDDPMCAGSGTVEGDTFEGFNSRYLIGNRGVEFLVNIDLCWAQVCLGGTIGTIATAQPGDDLSARLFWGIRFGTNGAPLAERTSSSPSRANRPERAERPEQEENDDSVGEDDERAEEEEAEEEVAAETDDSNSWK